MATEERASAASSYSEQTVKPSDQDVEKSSESNAGFVEPKTDADYVVSFTGDDDPRSPKSMSTARKWLIVAIVSTTSLCVACTSSLYTGTYGQIQKDFHASEIVTTLGLSMFVVGLGLSPMILAPLSEFYGRKPVYVVSMLFFVIWIIPCAVAQNINIDCGSIFQWVRRRSIPQRHRRDCRRSVSKAETPGANDGLYSKSFPRSRIRTCDWKLHQFLRELAMVLLRSPDLGRLRKETGDSTYYAPIEKMDTSIPQTILRSCYRPFILLTLEPMCLCLCLFCSVLLGVLYLFFGAFGLVFENNHGFNLWQVGLSFLGITVGMIIGIGTNPLWHRNFMRLLQAHQAKTGVAGSSEPEFRLPPAIGGAPLVTIGLFWFGWTTYSSVHWIVPIIGSSIFGAGVIMIFSGVFTFLVDAYPLYAASALAANSFSRSMFAAAFPLFGQAMFRNLGYQWASFLLGMITLLLAPFPYIFYKWGSKIRAHSRYAGAK